MRLTLTSDSMINVNFFDGTYAGFKQWWATDFSKRSHYKTFEHLCKAIEVCGFIEVNSANIEHVKAALEQRAAAKQA